MHTKEFDEELYTRRLEEGYDIYDENYVRQLFLKHPNEVCSDWLDKTPTSSKLPQVHTGKGYQHVAGVCILTYLL